jgi:aspartate-semialdehyde dehydrogenase
MKPVRLAIIGATGLVGRTTLDVLAEWRIPLESLRLFASANSGGRKIHWNGCDYELEPLNGIPDDANAAILALSSGLSKEWAPKLAQAGITVIDHSSAFRMDENVPLVIPEINGHALRSHRNLISNPNCSASVILMALAPLERVIGLERVICATYQSVSGAGQEGLSELDEQERDQASRASVFPRMIHENLFPEIGARSDSGYMFEEEKISEEICKILERPDLHCSATAVRVPVRVGHGAAVSVALKRRASLEEITAAMSNFPGLNCEGFDYKTPREIAGQQEVHVGRVRLDSRDPNWLHLWVVGDNLRKGAASNAVQILQELARN